MGAELAGADTTAASEAGISLQQAELLACFQTTSGLACDRCLAVLWQARLVHWPPAKLPALGWLGAASAAMIALPSLVQPTCELASMLGNITAAGSSTRILHSHIAILILLCCLWGTRMG